MLPPVIVLKKLVELLVLGGLGVLRPNGFRGSDI
jgi:hypothetical protein